jgi:mRNA interferase YafQ
MLSPLYTAQFRRDVKKCQQRGKDMEKLKAAVRLLLEQALLPPQYKDHALKGAWNNRRELHLEPDWLLVYKIAGEHCTFDRTGTHSDLFGK